MANLTIRSAWRTRRDWMEEDVAMLADMANRGRSSPMRAPHYDRYEEQEMVDRSAGRRGAEGLLLAAMPERILAALVTYAHEAVIAEALRPHRKYGFAHSRCTNASVAPSLHFGSSCKRRSAAAKMGVG